MMLSIKTCKRLAQLVTVILVVSWLLFVMLMKDLQMDQDLPVKVINRKDLSRNELFEPEVSEDFPTNYTEIPLIPHIIHQTYKDENIPEEFTSYVKSFKTKNPSWKYYFWTDKSARQLISERHPSFLPVWDNYGSNINRADALRYFVLYEFGGIYADLDVECLRPLDRATFKYSAIFPPEPIEHCFRLHVPFLLGNAIMMSRPKHPFLKQIIDSLSNFQPMADQIDSAGPCFVTTQFMIYNKFKPGDAYRLRKENDTSSPYFYKGDLREDDINAVFVPNTHYFMHTLNVVGVGTKYYGKYCKTHYNTSDILVKRGCHEFWLRTTKEDPNRFTFTEHHWFQTYHKKLKKFEQLSHVLDDFTVYT